MWQTYPVSHWKDQGACCWCEHMVLTVLAPPVHAVPVSGARMHDCIRGDQHDRDNSSVINSVMNQTRVNLSCHLGVYGFAKTWAWSFDEQKLFPATKGCVVARRHRLRGSSKDQQIMAFQWGVSRLLAVGCKGHSIDTNLTVRERGTKSDQSSTVCSGNGLQAKLSQVARPIHVLSFSGHVPLTCFQWLEIPHNMCFGWLWCSAFQKLAIFA